MARAALSKRAIDGPCAVKQTGVVTNVAGRRGDACLSFAGLVNFLGV